MSFTRPEDLHTTFAEALAAGDVEALLDLYEPGATTVLPDGGEITDPEARRAMFEGMLKAPAGMQGTSRRSFVAGGLALTSTAYEDRGADGPSFVTAEVSRLQPDGSWRVVLDVPFFAGSPQEGGRS